jgi:hypothetical protein
MGQAGDRMDPLRKARNELVNRNEKGEKMTVSPDRRSMYETVGCIY